MARKSNKTAHVLNLLAGNDTKKDEPVEEKSDEISESVTESEPAAASSSSQSVAVIDTTGPDPVAALIHDQLLNELHEELPEAESPANEEPPVEAQPVPEPAENHIAEEPVPASAETVIAEEPVPAPEETVITEEPVPAPEETIITEEPVPAPAETVIAEEPVPEPDFVRLNIMERIVEDKIIYFMREFDVCTCERCKADVIALTLNGLPSRYIVTSPFAVEPLISFYTNKYISDVTVEATKACIVIRDNPRH